MQIQGSEITHTEMTAFLFCIVSIYIFVLKLSDTLKIKHLLITWVVEDRADLNNNIFRISAVLVQETPCPSLHVEPVLGYTLLWFLHTTLNTPPLFRKLSLRRPGDVSAKLKGINSLTILHLPELFIYAGTHWWTLLFEFLSKVILTIPLLAKLIVVILVLSGNHFCRD